MVLGKKPVEVKCTSYHIILEGGTWCPHDITSDFNLDYFVKGALASFLNCEVTISLSYSINNSLNSTWTQGRRLHSISWKESIFMYYLKCFSKYISFPLIYLFDYLFNHYRLIYILLDYNLNYTIYFLAKFILALYISPVSFWHASILRNFEHLLTFWHCKMFQAHPVIFSYPVWELTNSSRSSGSFYCRMVFRNEDLGSRYIGCY